MSYIHTYKNIKSIAIGATRELFSPEFFQLTEEDKYKRMIDWLRAMSGLYGVTTPSLAITDSDECESGQYLASSFGGAIELPKFSVVSLAHEFRHHLQHDYEGLKRARGMQDNEDDARGWSLSLLFEARPAMLKQSVKKGYVLYADVADFTDSEA